MVDNKDLQTNILIGYAGYINHIAHQTSKSYGVLLKKTDVKSVKSFNIKNFEEHQNNNNLKVKLIYYSNQPENVTKWIENFICKSCHNCKTNNQSTVDTFSLN